MWRPEVESAPLEQLTELQQQRLEALLERLRAIPYYRERLPAKGAKLAELPFITKADLREQYPFGLLGVPPTAVRRIHATSGTKGKPTVIAYTGQDLKTWAEIAARMLYAAGCRPGEAWYIASGYGLFTGGLGAHGGAELIGALTVPASSGNSTRLVQLLKDLPTKGIHCIPSYMLRVAEVAENQGVDPRSLGLRYGSFGGETWSEPLRRHIEARFGLKAYDVYGLSEGYGPGVAYECEAQGGLHLSLDHFIFEIIDPATGEPVAPGQLGELVLTTLTKEAMPLLRYRTGDLTRLLPGPCPCGRTLPRIDRISGRSDDMLIIRGVNLFPVEVERLLLSFPEVGPEYRLVVERPGALDQLTLEIEMKADRPVPTDLSQVIAAEIKRQLGVTTRVRLTGEGMLPRPEGKSRRVLDLRHE